MLSKIAKYTLLLLCGVLLFAGCPTDGVNGLDGTDGLDGKDGKDGVNAEGGTGPFVSEAYFPVVDALSSASILRVDPQTMVYVGERAGTSYSLNRVDISDLSSKINQ
jgi:hypothetical protein